MSLTSGPNLGLLINGDEGEEHYAELMRQFRGLDFLIQPHVLDKDLTSPPGSPADGDAYIVGISPSGAWSGHATDLARYSSVETAWEFFDPKEGWEVWVDDENKRYRFTGSAWIDTTSSLPSLPVFDVLLDYGAAADGVTDDTVAVQSAMADAKLAGGGRLLFRRGTGDYIIAGALQDTGRSNSQLVLPILDVLDEEQITIEFVGEFAPPPVVSVVGDTDVPDSQVVLRSTLTSGSGGAMLGGWGPSGSFDDFTFVHFVTSGITYRMPDNPTHTALDLSHAVSCDIDQVVIDTGSYYVQGLPEPTTSGSYGIRFPKNGNGAYTRVGALNIIGFYQGFQASEHTNVEQLSTWGCKWAGEFNFAHHASHFKRLMAVHCQHGLKFTGGAHYIQIDQFNIEHAASGWWAPVDDVYDPSDYCYGNLQWHVVLAGVGVDHTFTVNGGANLVIKELGVGGASAAQVQNDEMMAGLIETVANKTYKFVVKATHAGTITEATTICGSGSCTATFKINTTALGGTANSVSTTEQSQAHSSANVFTAGDDIQLTVSGNSSCADLSFRLKYTRSYD